MAFIHFIMHGVMHIVFMKKITKLTNLSPLWGMKIDLSKINLAVFFFTLDK